MDALPTQPSLDRRNPLTSGLVAAYHFINPHKPKELVSNQNVGTLVHNRDTSKVGNGVITTNVRGYSLPSNCVFSTINANQRLSLEAWVKRTGTTQYGVFIAYTIPSTNVGFVFQISHLAPVAGTGIAVYLGISPYIFSSYSIPNDNLPHQVIVTADSQELKLYADGIYKETISSIAWGANTGSTSSLRKSIGSYTDASTYSFAGSIYSIRAWNRVLSSNEVAQLYSNPWAMYRPLKLKGARTPETVTTTRRKGGYVIEK